MHPHWQSRLRAAAALLLLLNACRRQPAAQAPENAERNAFVAQPCPQIAFGAEPVDANNARVFVEVVDVSARDLPDPVGDWFQEHAVSMRSSANLVAFPNVPTSVPWGQCVDAVCSSAQRSLSVTARLPALGTDPIELTLRIDESAPGAEGAAPKLLLDTSLQARSQQPLVLPPQPGLTGGSVVVTAYLLRKLDDLHRLLECQARQTERAKQLP
jgi:hypothetical protein